METGTARVWLLPDNDVSCLPLFRPANNHDDMTFFCRQPPRLLYQFSAARPHTSAHLAHHVRIVLPKARLGLCLRSASNAAPSQTGLGAFAMACLVIAPNVYFDESSPVWMAPAVIAVSATLVPLFHVLTRPSVANIFIDAPASARRSKEALVSFAKRVPLDTALEIQTLGLLSVPRTKTLRVGELRVRPEGWGRLANLEQVHAIDKTSKIPKWARWSLQRFYARPVASRWKNSRAPEVWPLVLEAITRNTVANMSKKNLSPPLNAVPSARLQPPPSVVRPAHPAAAVVQKQVQKKAPTVKAAPTAVFYRESRASFVLQQGVQPPCPRLSSAPTNPPAINSDTLTIVNGTSANSPAPSSVQQPGLSRVNCLSRSTSQVPADPRAASRRRFCGSFVVIDISLTIF
ncbi:hypothetical protein E4T52_05676 [Aureobasidium sp. EXF-3400]|nr:hypothetical protein E4T51_04851 [Aureobasidium sp. EXF-12344]KAI4779406.1 hypothetical protein E4T52_05676 [Aureobasidium sp. EXF-3400]